MQWKESGDLGLVEEVEKEWDLFCRALIGAGVKLQDRSDELKWIGEISQAFFMSKMSMML
jgi:hypothetical protein